VARYKRVVGDPVRLGSIEILRRKVIALRNGASDPVGVVFNPVEISILRRLAKGERIPKVVMTRERAEEEIAWIYQAAKTRNPKATEAYAPRPIRRNPT